MKDWQVRFLYIYSRRTLLLCMLVAVIAGCYNRAEDFHQLTDSYRTTDAYVVWKSCANRGFGIYYGFRVEGKEYRGKAPDYVFVCSKVKVGDTYTVYFDPKHPETNSLLPPSEAYARARGWYVPTFLWYVVVWPSIPLGALYLAARSGKARR